MLGVEGCQRYFIIFFSEFCLWNTMKNQCNFHWKETQGTKLSDQKLKNCEILQLNSYLYTLHKERMSAQIVQLRQMKAKAMEHWLTHEDETRQLKRWQNERKMMQSHIYIAMEEDDHWDLKTKVKETNETLQGTKCEILLALASILFTLIWKIKGRKNQSNQMKAQCEEEMTIISFLYLLTQ